MDFRQGLLFPALLLFGGCQIPFEHLPTQEKPGSPTTQALWDGKHLPALYLEDLGTTDAASASDTDPMALNRMRMYPNLAGTWADPSVAPPSAPPFVQTEAPLFDGWAGIKIRGQSSSTVVKKSFALELKKEASGLASKNKVLLDFPPDNDFILHSADYDGSLLRNYLAYSLSSATGRWAPRVHFLELYGRQHYTAQENAKGWVDAGDRYQGVYLLTEKIKVRPDRVNIDRLEASDTTEPTITGGYILAFDKTDADGSEWLMSGASSGIVAGGLYCKVPTKSTVNQQQKAYITSYIRNMEAAMRSGLALDPSVGYQAWIDVPSFIDFFLTMELTRNIDGYRYSSYFYKPLGAKLFAGPVWDFDLAMGNVANLPSIFVGGRFEEGGADRWSGTTGTTQIANGWMLVYRYQAMTGDLQASFWWKVLLADPTFRARARIRYQNLRAGPWSDAAIQGVLARGRAEFEGAIPRETALWTKAPTSPSGWGPTVDTRTDWAKSKTDYEFFYADLSQWLVKRTAWLDKDSSWTALETWAQSLKLPITG